MKKALIEMMTYMVTVPVWVLILTLIIGAILPMILTRVLDEMEPFFTGTRRSSRTRSSSSSRGRRGR